MSTTDTPIKVLLREFPQPCAAWLLNTTEANIHYVQELNIDLPPKEPLRADSLLQVTLADGSLTLLHIEIQGKSSNRPMHWRMLDYINLIAQNQLQNSQNNLCSVVIYVGEGAGKADNGEYAIDCPLGNKTLTWSYRVIHLWEMPAEFFLETGVPALIALIGQTRMEHPRETIIKAINSIQTQVQDKEKQAQLYSIFSSLQQNEEAIKMVEQYLNEMEVDIFDTPLLRRVRGEGRNEGYEKAIAEGKELWEADGEERSLRNALLDVIALRFNTPINNYRQLETYLNQINDAKLLRTLHQKAILADDFMAFMQNIQSNPTTNMQG